MPHRTLDEYLKQTTHITTKQPATKQRYKIAGFYKETQFQETTIGKIPKEWNVLRLEYLASAIYYGVTAKAVEHDTGLRMLRTSDIKDYKVDWGSLPYCEITSKINDIKKYLLKKGDLIVARAGTVGVSVLVDRDFNNVVFGSYLIKVRPKENIVYPKFLYYYFQSKPYWSHISKAQGSTLKNINLGILRSLSVPLPPLEEQWGIAEVLSSVDEAIEATERFIVRLERLKRGLMQELLTKGIGHREYKQTPIGKIPKQWQVVKLGALFTFKNGKRPNTVRESGQIPIYGAGFIQGYTDDFMLDKDNVIIIARVGKGSAGKVYIASGKMWISDNAIYATPKSKKAYPVFYYYLLQFLRLDKIAVRSAAGGYSLITQSSLNNLYVPLPPYEEQKQIADALSSMDNWVEQEKKFKNKLERLKRGLMELLLTGRVRVRVERLDDEGNLPGSGGGAGS